MEKYRQRIIADHVFNRGLPALCGQGDLLLLHFAAGVGDIDRAVDHRGNAGPRTAAGYGNGHLRIFLTIGLSPGLGDVDECIRALVLDGGAGLHVQRQHNVEEE